MRSALIVTTSIFMRRFAVLAVMAAILGGCSATRPVTAPTTGGVVRIQYGDPPPTLTVLTTKHGLVELPRVRMLEARIIELRADSIRVRVLWTTPSDRRIYWGTSMIAHPSDSSRPQKWTRKQFLLGRTIALIVIPPAVFLGLVALALSTDDSW